MQHTGPLVGVFRELWFNRQLAVHLCLPVHVVKSASGSLGKCSTCSSNDLIEDSFLVLSTQHCNIL